MQDFPTPVPSSELTRIAEAAFNTSADRLIVVAGIVIFVVAALFLLVIWKGINPFLSLLKSQTEELRATREENDKQRKEAEKEIHDLQAQNTDTRDELKRSVDALVKLSSGLQADVSIIKDQGAQSVEKLDNVNGAIGQVDEKIDHIVASVNRLTKYNDDTQIGVTLLSLKDELVNLKTAVSDLRIEVEKRRTNTKPIPIITDEQLEKSA